jgi:DnaJ-class molecular chaperone
MTTPDAKRIADRYIGSGATCSSCGGTGWLFAANSWFAKDGYRRFKCSTCGGTGRSNCRCDPDYVSFQKQCRERIGNALAEGEKRARRR